MNITSLSTWSKPCQKPMRVKKSERPHSGTLNKALLEVQHMDQPIFKKGMDVKFILKAVKDDSNIFTILNTIFRFNFE